MGGRLERAGLLVCAAASAICLGGCSYEETSWGKKVAEGISSAEQFPAEYFNCLP